MTLFLELPVGARFRLEVRPGQLYEKRDLFQYRRSPYNAWNLTSNQPARIPAGARVLPDSDRAKKG